jgi:flagellar protein FliO/FliZ
MLAVWFLVQIPAFSQEVSAQEDHLIQGEQAVQPAQEDPLRAAEQALTFGETASPGASFGTGPSVWSVIRMILVLALAAAAIYGAVFFIRRSTKQTAASDPFLKVLASSHLGSNRYVHVVYAGNKAWLVGSSDGGVNLIGEVEDKETIDAMLLDDSRRIAEAPEGNLSNFLSVLKKFGAPVSKKTPGADEIRRRRERLKGL